MKRKLAGLAIVLQLAVGARARVTVRALASDGNLLAERTLELGWTRVGGSEACGGPATAGPINLTV
ncbi:hypothetical protein ACX80S_04460 [Arthrobacter sp. RHLT1-20]